LPIVVGPTPSTAPLSRVVAGPALPVVLGLEPGTHAERRARSRRHACGALLVLLALAACTHRVQVEAPKEPIVINLNVKIEQEVRIRVEEDVEDLLEENPDIF